MTLQNRDSSEQRFENNWAQWIMETAYRWEDFADVIKLTGIDMIDDDHRKLIEYTIEFNRLFDLAEERGLDLDFIKALEKLFEQLHGFTKEHFTREQILIKKFGIEGLEKQEIQHKKFLIKLTSYMDEIESGKLNIALKFKSIYMDWLVDHVNHIDFDTFRLDKIGPVILSKANKWDDVSDLIRSMGMYKIDDDHRVMTEYALELNDFIDEESRWDPVTFQVGLKKLLQKLLAFASEHFQREEKIISRYNLQYLERQKKEHREFISMLKGAISDLEANRTISAKRLKAEFLNWWVRHINVIDYSSFKENNWAVNIISTARTWEDLEELIYTMGVDVIDEQHRIQTVKILELTDLLEKYEKQKGDRSILDQVIHKSEQIYRFAVKHFETEERLLLRLKVSNLDGHKAEHKALLEKIQDHLENIKSGKMLVSMKLKLIFADWWINHINHVDYQSFYKDSAN